MILGENVRRLLGSFAMGFGVCAALLEHRGGADGSENRSERSVQEPIAEGVRTEPIIIRDEKGNELYLSASGIWLRAPEESSLTAARLSLSSSGIRMYSDRRDGGDVVVGVTYSESRGGRIELEGVGAAEPHARMELSAFGNAAWVSMGHPTVGPYPDLFRAKVVASGSDGSVFVNLGGEGEGGRAKVSPRARFEVAYDLKSEAAAQSPMKSGVYWELVDALGEDIQRREN